MKIDVTKCYYVGFYYNNGEYSMVTSGILSTGITNKYKLHCLFPVEGSKLTKDMGGLSCTVLDINVDVFDVEKVVQGGVKALQENFGCEIECSFDRKGHLTFLRWVK